MVKKKQIAGAINQTFKGSAPPVNNEQNWDELEDMYQTCAQALCGTLESVKDLVNNPAVIKNVPNPGEFKVAVDGLVQDVNTFTDHLVNIHSQHIGKTGKIMTNDEVATSFGIYGQYSEFFEKYKALTFQTVTSILEMSGEAIAAEQEKNKTQSEGN